MVVRPARTAGSLVGKPRSPRGPTDRVSCWRRCSSPVYWTLGSLALLALLLQPALVLFGGAHRQKQQQQLLITTLAPTGQSTGSQGQQPTSLTARSP